MIIYIEKPKESTKQLLELISEFIKAAESKIHKIIIWQDASRREGSQWLNNIIKDPSSFLSSTLSNITLIFMIARWLTQLQTSHPPKAISKDQSKKKTWFFLVSVYEMRKLWQSPAAPRLSFISQNDVTCPFMNQLLAMEAELPWMAWNIQGSHSLFSEVEERDCIP